MTDTDTDDADLLPGSVDDDGPRHLAERPPPEPAAPSHGIYRSLWVLLAGMAVLFAAVVALVVWIGVINHREKVDHAQSVALYGQAAAAGVKPVVTPSDAPTVTVTGPTGPTGPGPSVDEIGQAVALYCQTSVCGIGPSAAQVAQAVASYCGADGQCKGPAGTGSTGPQGPAGSDGANATAQQVADAVNAYCTANGGCAGTAGAPGTNGANGTDGQPPVSWSYTDVLGGSHTCSRTDPFDASAPTYTCS